jgi:hypothetical protein
MGVTGPIPKRADERRRRNKVDTTQVEVYGEVEPPPADERWHKVALDWYTSLAESGQSKFYEPSDWATAYMVAESISRDMKPQVVGVHPETGEPIMAVVPLKGTSLSSYLKAMAVLLVTEGDRRRVQMEIVRRPEPVEAPAGVTRLDDYRDL